MIWTQLATTAVLFLALWIIFKQRKDLKQTNKELLEYVRLADSYREANTELAEELTNLKTRLEKERDARNHLEEALQEAIATCPRDLRDTLTTGLRALQALQDPEDGD